MSYNISFYDDNYINNLITQPSDLRTLALLYRIIPTVAHKSAWIIDDTITIDKTATGRLLLPWESLTDVEFALNNINIVARMMSKYSYESYGRYSKVIASCYKSPDIDLYLEEKDYKALTDDQVKWFESLNRDDEDNLLLVANQTPTTVPLTLEIGYWKDENTYNKIKQIIYVETNKKYTTYDKIFASDELSLAEFKNKFNVPTSCEFLLNIAPSFSNDDTIFVVGDDNITDKIWLLLVRKGKIKFIEISFDDKGEISNMMMTDGDARLQNVANNILFWLIEL